MTNNEAAEKLARQKNLLCHGCVHPSMVGWCEEHCQLPEAFDMAINALTTQPQHDISKANFLCPICGAEMEVAVSEWEGES